MKIQDKFMKLDDFSRSIGNSISKLSDQKIEILNSSFDPFSITECPRRLIYKTGGRYEDNRSYLDICIQESIQKKWVDFFNYTKNIGLEDFNVIVNDHNFNLLGKIDILVNINGASIPVKIKALSDTDFVKIQTGGGFKKDVTELIICTWMAEKKDGLLIYENINNQQYIIFHVETYKPIIDSIKTKCVGLLDHKINGTIPNQPYKKDDSEECKKCEFFKMCWNN